MRRLFCATGSRAGCLPASIPEMWRECGATRMNATLDTALEFRDRLAGEDMRDLCPDARLVIDVGAGKGGFARNARVIWPEARIVSFEPASRLFNRSRSIDDNHEIFHQAVGEFYGHVTLYLTYGEESNSLLPFLPGNPLEKIHTVVGEEYVDQVCLDHVTYDVVSVLKMDAQGAELRVLDGAQRILRDDKPLIYTEVAFQQQYEGQPLLEDVDAYLAGYGYRRLYLYESPRPDIWGDAIYVCDDVKQTIRLNIGAGDTVIDGFTPIDRRFGTEAYPLDYPDNSVEEIRCVHMLEHLDFREAMKALKEWNRVLRPGGRLRVSVPDIDVCAKSKDDDHWPFYIMGGQIDGNDYHKSVYDRKRLEFCLESAGFENAKKWTSPNVDLASCNISLNLEAFKPGGEFKETSVDIKVRAVCGMPRIGWNDAWVSICDALRPFNIPIETHQGCFWAQNLHKAFERALESGVDWLITLDYDSMIQSVHVARLLEIMGTHPEIDACAALQMRRGQEVPLLSNGSTSRTMDDLEPFQVNTAHFGLTIIRTESLRDIPKPWLIDVPDANGTYDGTHTDADIHFWKQWTAAGRTVYVAPDVRIGHLELLVSEFDEDLKPRHFHIGDWWDRHSKLGHCMRTKKEI